MLKAIARFSFINVWQEISKGSLIMTAQEPQPLSSAIGQPPKSFGILLGTMYKRWVLDCIVYLGYAVSVDFSNRPELYKQVNGGTATQLTDMQSRYGFEPNFPNDAIRLMLLKPIFGESDGHGSRNDDSIFQTARMPVLAAAADFSENAQPLAFPMHRERTRSAIIPFKRFMEDLEGASLRQTESRTKIIFNTGAAILRDRDVSAVFGINELIDATWPLQSTDPQGAKLIEKITTQLPNMPYGVISRDKFVRMQRIAEKGFESIRFILETDIESISATEKTLDPLIRQLYALGSDLGLVGGATPQVSGATPRMMASI
jgi:hypothetical protein